MSGSLQLVPCKGFPVCQPFSVQIEDDAMVVMDFHAHLSRFEVIGYLGGEWDSVKKHLYIKSAFPCRGKRDISTKHPLQTRVHGGTKESTDDV